MLLRAYIIIFFAKDKCGVMNVKENGKKSFLISARSWKKRSNLNYCNQNLSSYVL